ncbi:MAG: hypothetical protein RI554_10995, partial [Trueperaceae bacterium]|nr:hypothetical protein [Trueperaceae bacterium]
SEGAPPFGGDGDEGRLGPIDGDAPDAGAPDEGAGPRIALDGTEVVQGGSLTVTFAGGPGNPRDWVGVYAAGAETGTNYLGWAYVSGTQTAGAGLREGRITFPRVNLPPGTYDVWFFVDDGYETIAGPERFTVRAP